MIYAVRINNTLINKISDINTVEVRDRTYDFGKLVQYKSTDKDAFPMKSLVQIDRDDGVTTKTGYWHVQGDIPTSIDKDLGVHYRHEITLIEITKRLDDFLTGQKAFTTNDTAFNTLDNLLKTHLLHQTSFSDFSRTIPLLLTKPSLDPLKTLNARDLYFNNVTLTEAIEALMIEVGGFPRITTDGTDYFLEMDLINEKTNFIDLEDGRLDYQQSQNINQYATTLDSSVENVIYDKVIEGASIVEPSIVGFKGVKSESAVFNSDNSIFRTEKPIYQLIKAELNIKLVDGSFQAIDITNRIVDEEAFQGLQVSNSFNIDFSPRSQFILTVEPTKGTINISTSEVFTEGTKAGTLFFKRGSNIIQGLYTIYGGRWSDPVIKYLTDSAVYDVFGEDTDLVILPTEQDSFNIDFENLQLRIEYIPSFNARVQVERKNIDVIDKVTTLITNQSAKTVSAERALKSSYTRLQEMGTRDIMIARQHKLNSEEYEMGSFDKDNFILSQKETENTRDFFDVKYKLDKNFQKISEDVRVDSLLRLYDIPSDSDIIERQLIYKEYVEWDFVQDTQETTKLQFEGKSIFMNLFVQDSIYNKKVNNVLINNPDRFSTLTPFMLSVSSFGGGNALNFEWAINSPLIVGEQLDTTSEEIPILVPLEYSNSDGTMDNLSWEYTNSCDSDYKLLPRVNYSDRDFKIIGDIFDDYVFLKDPAESTAMNYQLHNIMRNIDILIGDYFVNRNNTIEEILSFPNLVVYTSNDTYGENDTVKVKGNPSPITFTATEREIRLDSIAGASSWAIGTPRNGDAGGDLLIGVNQKQLDDSLIDRRVVFPNYKNSRSDEDYGI